MTSTTATLKDVVVLETAEQMLFEQFISQLGDLQLLEELPTAASSIHFNIKEVVELLPSGELRLIYVCEGVEIMVDVPPEHWKWKDPSRLN